MLWAFVTQGQGASFDPQPFPKTIENAPVIVRGKVGMKYSDWGMDADGSKRLYTFYELQVNEILKGNASRPSLTMRELGGEKDGISMQIPGASQYDRGEDVVVLLKTKNSEGSFDIQGLMTGKYQIETDSDGSEYLTGAGINDQVEHSGASPASHPLPTKWYLSTLRQLIETQAESKTQDSSNPLPISGLGLEKNLEKSSPSPLPSLSIDPIRTPPPVQPTETTWFTREFLTFLGFSMVLIGGFTILKNRK